MSRLMNFRSCSGGDFSSIAPGFRHDGMEKNHSRKTRNVPDKPSNKRINTDAAVRMCFRGLVPYCKFILFRDICALNGSAGYARVSFGPWLLLLVVDFSTLSRDESQEISKLNGPGNLGWAR